jgi:hypothetical protein
VDISLNAERARRYVLLVAAVTGAALGAKAPQRWARAGGGLLLAGLSALLARDVAMIASGTPTGSRCGVSPDQASGYEARRLRERPWRDPASCRADGWMAVMTRPTACRHSSTTKLAISET